MKRKKNNSQETFSSQLVGLWESCSKLYLTLVMVLSLLSAVGINFCKLYFEGADINNIYSFLIWDNCIIHFVLLSFFIWIFLLNKKVFSPHNISNRASRFKQAFDRIISKGHSVQFYWLVSSFVLLFLFLSSLMGTIDSFGIFPRNMGLDWNPISLTYLLLTDTSTVSSVLKTQSHVANILAAICIVVSLLGTLLFTGLLVSVFSNFLQRRVEDYEKGRLRYDLSDHIVFIGYDEILPPLVKQCVEYEANRNRKIVVQTKLPSEQVREDIKTLITDDALYRNIIFYNGRRDSVKDLMNLDLERASEIFVIGDRSNVCHDELNLQCVQYIKDIISKKCDKSEVPIHLLIEDQIEYSKMLTIWDEEEAIRVYPFNIYVFWAKQLIHGNSKYPQITVKNNESSKDLNIVIWGMTKFGSAIGIEALHAFKYNNRRVVITFICDNAYKEMEKFKTIFSHLFQSLKYSFIDFINPNLVFNSNDNSNFILSVAKLNVEIEFVDSSPYSKELYSFLENKKTELFVFNCSNWKTNDLYMALFMPHKILANSHLYVLQKYGSQFIEKLDYPQMYPFGMNDNPFDLYSSLEKRNNEPSKIIDDYIQSASTYQDLGNWEKANIYLQKALELQKQLGFDDAIINTFINIGHVNYINNINTAIDYYEQAFQAYLKVYGRDLKSAELADIIGCAYLYAINVIPMPYSYFEAARSFIYSLYLRIELLGEKHPLVAVSYSNMAIALKEFGEWTDGNFTLTEEDCLKKIEEIEKYQKDLNTDNIQEKCTE